MASRYHAVLFDLLSALLDSQTLWDDVAGDRQRGSEWRMHYLAAAATTGQYRDYVQLIRDSAQAAGVAPSRPDALVERWGELVPWPEAAAIIAEFASRSKIGIVTNCSERLGVDAAAKIGVAFDVIVTAERAGCYKPDPGIYELAIREIGEAPERILYVAGSPYDVRGAAAAGMPVYWHNRLGLADPVAGSIAARTAASLDDSVSLFG